MLTLMCEWCGKQFSRKPSLAKEAVHHFCSAECKQRWSVGKPSSRKTSIMVRCEWCNKEVERKLCLIKRHIFCGQACKGFWRRGKPLLSEEGKERVRQAHLGVPHPEMSARPSHEHPRWKGDHPKNPKDTGGIRARAVFPAEPCEVCGRGPSEVKVHRHHRDRNPMHNERTNIQFLCSTHHQQLHARIKREEKEMAKCHLSAG